MPFISLIASSNAQALNLLLTFSQRVFLSVYPLFNIEGNSPTSPTLSAPSIKLTDLSGGIPVMRVIPPCFCDSNKMIMFQGHCGFQLLLLISQAIYVGVEAFPLGYWHCYLFRGDLLKSFGTILRIFPDVS